MGQAVLIGRPLAADVCDLSWHAIRTLSHHILLRYSVNSHKPVAK